MLNQNQLSYDKYIILATIFKIPDPAIGLNYRVTTKDGPGNGSAVKNYTTGNCRDLRTLLADSIRVSAGVQLRLIVNYPALPGGACRKAPL